MPGLADSLNSHALELVRAGRSHEALEACAEAVSLLRAAVGAEGDAHLPNLAVYLVDLARITLWSEGDVARSVEITEEAYRYLDELAARDPRCFRGLREAVRRDQFRFAYRH
ncbi:hypothetical protein [Paractinoplanes deccanensis]|uniref:hypothetical protein n=1 Tax=Paractinoplanes deccanensis TaxID=113561 RepID=UPI001942192F|nr:hypothetical protein [Actinoplanes deccanensis]